MKPPVRKVPIKRAGPASKPAAQAPAGAIQTSSEARQFTIDTDDDGIRLDRWFHRHLPDVNFNLVSRWARTGQVRLDGKRVGPGDRIAAGQTIRIPPSEAEPEQQTARVMPKTLSEDQVAYAQSMVIHRDRAALVINKPPGLATQGGTRTHAHVDGLGEALMFDSVVRPRLVHRLDKDTSGVLLLARTPGSAAYFAKRFAGRNAKKIYWALVVGVPDIYSGLIELPLAKQPGTGGEKMHVDEENGQPSRTAYQVIERAGSRAAWVALQPFTGRTHQLRVHMAAIGHPIVGDGKYGGQNAFLTGTISRKMHLHARRLRIAHPDGPALDVTAELPEHFAESMESLGFDLALGETAFADEGPEPATREVKKQQARAHAKTIRKERRGERRSRSGAAAPVGKGKPAGKAKPAAPGKPGARSKPVTPRTAPKAPRRP
ncbi:RluA family pseudouridine synthase [Blastomonas sp.]|uniref:RluA family pseudouridine synthase n=1 Tax=Blastomonas sp. TaxID=1909299 RepID=UPI0026181AC3|nr:RluA family pseudouridine synthase [Blastomonas sp.]MDM7957244.1 RluA family pseudouridine synthase [Blastomonas sp.]